MILSDSKTTMSKVISALEMHDLMYPDDGYNRALQSLRGPTPPVVFITEGEFVSSDPPKLTQYRGVAREYIPGLCTVIQVTDLGDQGTILHELMHAAGYGEGPAYEVGDRLRGGNWNVHRTRRLGRIDRSR